MVEGKPEPSAQYVPRIYIIELPRDKCNRYVLCEAFAEIDPSKVGSGLSQDALREWFAGRAPLLAQPVPEQLAVAFAKFGKPQTGRMIGDCDTPVDEDGSETPTS